MSTPLRNVRLDTWPSLWAANPEAQVKNLQDLDHKNVGGALPGPMDHLGDKADLTPSPLRVSGSHRGGLTGETNDVVRCYGFALTEQASVTLLMPRRNHCSPAWLPAEPGAGEWS